MEPKEKKTKNIERSIEIIDFNVKYTYTCQYCRKEFKSSKPLHIILNYSPLCSNICVFKKYYHILSKYRENTLISIRNILNIKKSSDFNKNTLIFEITKKYPKPNLSSINREINSEDMGQDIKQEVKCWPTVWDKRQDNYYYI